MNNNKKELDKNFPILPIGAVSAALGVHQRTLRIYDKEGILCPNRTTKNRRHYSINDLEKAKVVLFLTRNLALNLSGVKIILALLEVNKVKQEDYMDYITKIVKATKIDAKVQEENIKKTSSRGRKPNSASKKD